ncbi:hypothetical protein E4U52_004493 [Claviceps spartinae]|nr:hypothetical protein E4U52_004493 [Claviceps spartinae]
MTEKRCPQATARRVARALCLLLSAARDRGLEPDGLDDFGSQYVGNSDSVGGSDRVRRDNLQEFRIPSREKEASVLSIFPIFRNSHGDREAPAADTKQSHQAKPPNKSGLLDQQVAGPYLFTPLEPFTHRVLHSRTVALRLFISAPGKQPALRSHIAD